MTDTPTYMIPVGIGALADVDIRYFQHFAGAYMIIAQAVEMQRKLRGKKYETFQDSLTGLTLSQSDYIVKNGEAENLGERLKQHRQLHFRNIASARLLLVCKTSGGVGGFAQYVLNKLAEKTHLTNKAHGVDWFLTKSSYLTNYYERSLFLCRNVQLNMNEPAKVVIDLIATAADIYGPMPAATGLVDSPMPSSPTDKGKTKKARMSLTPYMDNPVRRVVFEE